MSLVEQENQEIVKELKLAEGEMDFEMDLGYANHDDADIQPDFVSAGVQQLYTGSLATYLKVRNLAYDKSTLIAAGFDNFEAICKKTHPWASSIYAKVGEPMVKGIDFRVNSLVGKLSSSTALPIAVTSSWLKRVDKTLTPHMDVRQSYIVFLRTATAVYIQLHDKAYASAVAAQQAASTTVSPLVTPIVVKYEDFQEALQQHLRRAWSSSLAQASRQAFDALNARALALTQDTSSRVKALRSATAAAVTDTTNKLQDTTARLRDSAANTISAGAEALTGQVPVLAQLSSVSSVSLRWAFPDLLETAKQALRPVEDAVISAFTQHLQRPAFAFYNYCTDNYLALALAAKERGQELVPADVSVFVERVRTQLGDAYTVQLEQPLQEYFQRAVTAKDALRSSGLRLLSAWNFEQGKLTLQEYFFRTQSAAASVSSSWLTYLGFPNAKKESEKDEEAVEVLQDNKTTSITEAAVEAAISAKYTEAEEEKMGDDVVSADAAESPAEQSSTASSEKEVEVVAVVAESESEEEAAEEEVTEAEESN